MFLSRDYTSHQGETEDKLRLVRFQYDGILTTSLTVTPVALGNVLQMVTWKL
jgi:hypothetical protein